jgi:radical SAM protein with 4Fe4S-binding SPASM domain
MSLLLFQKCINDLTEFPDKIKVLRFVGMGEPLLHKQLPEMIKYAADTQRFDRIEIITNASLLTNSLSDKLISANLTKLLVSIQGTSAKKYKEISNIDINIDKFIGNITYFYEHRNACKIHIKIADCALEDEQDKELFFKLFGDICNTIGIEKIGPIHPGVDYNKELVENNQQYNQYGENFTPVDMCTQPFYMMQINPDGNVVPCFSVPYPQILGNCINESLLNIWNGLNYNRFRLNLLNKQTDDLLCSSCQIFKHRAHDSDDLNTKIDILKSYYEYCNCNK